MFHQITVLLGRRSRLTIVTVAIAGVAAVGVADHYTGSELSLSIFYLMPIALATWFAGLRSGALLCCSAVAVWFAADVTAGHEYSHAAIRYWNAGVRLGFFAVTSWLLESLRRLLLIEQRLARVDSLTGTLNAHAFAEQSRRLFELSVRHQRPLTLAFVDLDDFKQVNDTLGHSEGDRVLRTVAEAMAARLRSTDVLARLGGDEFSILLPDTDGQGAERVLAEVRLHVEEVLERQHWRVGLSVGIIVFDRSIRSVDEALQQADELMLSAKRQGKNRIAVRHESGQVRVA